MNISALLNGNPASGLPFTDRGLAYGDGLFETVRVEGGAAQFLREHCERLERDCRRLAIALDRAALRAEIARVLQMALAPGQAADALAGTLKIVVTRAAGARGYLPERRADGQRLLLFFPQALPPFAADRQGVRVRICRLRLAEQPALAGMKHLNRLEQVLARSEWSDPDIAEGVMLDQQARPIEGTASNLFLVCGDRIQTPRLHRCGVAGVMRRIVMERLAAAAVVERDLSLDDLYSADEVFLTNSIFGIRPVAQIDCLRKRCGDVTIALQRSLHALIENESP